MIKRTLFSFGFSSPAFLVSAAGIATAALIAACSSSTDTGSGPTSCQAGTSTACTCAGGQSGTKACGSQVCACGNPGDGGAPISDGGNPGDGAHANDGAPPSTLYGACALQGSFGWPCVGNNDAGVDPTDCTDPSYPTCFVGGQGSWCSKACTATGNECASGVEDGGCVPTSCNNRGLCK